ncbi:unnamed protein product [Prorocentrum cordatum]|uniref:JmjC domain-containing protein n=1 Tax=Prorocentrum cordatum TaxID=2364126 RepID=A0ABN9UG40_9DINO|nr:unnamed protein product [Polarella glacialis]
MDRPATTGGAVVLTPLGGPSILTPLSRDRRCDEFPQRGKDHSSPSDGWRSILAHPGEQRSARTKPTDGTGNGRPRGWPDGVRRGAPPCPPHPALRRAVAGLLSEHWPRAARELRAAAPGAGEPEAAAEVGRPLRAAADDVEGAAAALERGDWARCAEAAQAARGAAWGAFSRGGGWRRPCDKELFMVAELLLALAAHARGDAAGAVRRADAAFVFAAPGAFREAAVLFVQWLDGQAARGAAEALGARRRRRRRKRRRRRRRRRTIPPTCGGGGGGKVGPPPVPRVEASEGGRLRAMAEAGEPFVVAGALEAWPARSKWASLASVDRLIGHRLVPVEVGAAVGGAGWREELMPAGRLLRDYLAPSCAECSAAEGAEAAGAAVAYLAQHELLEQCPVLRGDVAAPDLFRSIFGPPARANVWLGTRGTVTPCHWDSYNNCLAQVQGSKRAVLLPPAAGPCLYAAESEGGVAAQGNVSSVDVEAPDLERFPAYAGARSVSAELEPGDALFIPRGWWHQIRALSPSISVNFWF